jgi:hypothetical protein
MLGDSIADSLEYVPEARDLLGQGIDLRLELAPCRRLVFPGCVYQGSRARSALDIVQSSSLAELGNIVVVDVGYNEPAVSYDSDMGRLVDALASRGVEHIIWVTLREQTDNYRQINEIIRAQAGRSPRIEVADWEAVSRGKDWFNADGLHLNAAGALGLATLVRPFVLAACGSACQATRPPVSTAVAPRNTRPPSLRGVPRVGHVLSCVPGSWSGTTPMAFLYNWVRRGRVIPGVFGSSRRLVAADRGRRVACRVWAGNVAGVARATSRGRLVRGAP